MSSILNDSNVILETGFHIGFGVPAAPAVPAAASTLSRIINAASVAALNGVTTAPIGSIALCADGALAQNTDGATAWVARSDQTSTSTSIADPLDAGAIPVANSGSCNLTSLGVETRTMAIPTFEGQLIALTFDVTAGNITLTVAAAFDQGAHTTVTFNGAGDFVLFMGVQVAGVLVWRLVVNDGCALA